MFMKKLAAFLTGAVVLCLTLPVLAASQTPEKTADAAPAAARETADATPATERETDETDETDEPEAPRADGESEADAGQSIAPDNTPPAQKTEKPAERSELSIYLDGKDLTGGEALINWPDLTTAPPTATLKAVGPDGSYVSPVYDSSDDGVVFVDESGLVTAVGYGVATITATLDAQKAMLQVSVSHDVRRVIIIGEETVSHGRSVKLRAFDQDGNRIRAIWRTSSEKIATVNADGIVTAKRGASGQSVDVTAFADENLAVFAVKNIRID